MCLTLAMLYVFVKLYVTVFEFIYIWEILLFGASCFTMLFGAFGGYFSKIKIIAIVQLQTSDTLMCLVNSDF